MSRHFPSQALVVSGFLYAFSALTYPAAAQAQEVLDQASEWLDNATDSTQTKHRKQREAEEIIRRQQEELDWRRDLDERYPVDPTGTRNRRPRIEVYLASDCPECDAVERFLKDAAVPYTRYDLESDKAAEAVYLEKFGRGILPVTSMGRDVVIRGYDPDALRASLQRSPVQPGRQGTRNAPPSANADSWRADAPSTTPRLPAANTQEGYIRYEDTGSGSSREYDAGKPLGAVLPPSAK